MAGRQVEIHNNHTIYYLWLFANSLELKMTINHMHILHFFFFLGPLCKSLFGTSRCIVQYQRDPKGYGNDHRLDWPTFHSPSFPFPVSLPVANRQINKQVVVESKVQTDRQSWLGWGSDWKLGKLKGNCTFQFRIQIFPRFYWVFIWKGNKFIIEHYYYLLHCLNDTSYILDID